MKLTNFTKSHGLGNDFIIIEDLNDELRIDAGITRALCARHFGIGADGLMIVKSSENADYLMDFRNANGSTAQMCGNGIRAFAKYIYENLLAKGKLTIETGAGLKKIELINLNGLVEKVVVDMGEPALRCREIPVVADTDEFIDHHLVADKFTTNATCVSMGNPHCVIFVKDIKEIDVKAVGSVVETLDIFPEKTNVSFVEVVSEKKLRIRVWERGVGETLACGTGACASLVAANLNKLTSRQAEVDLPGGQLLVEWRDDNRVILTGGAKKVFVGQVDLDYWKNKEREIECS